MTQEVCSRCDKRLNLFCFRSFLCHNEDDGQCGLDFIRVQVVHISTWDSSEKREPCEQREAHDCLEKSTLESLRIVGSCL